MRNGKYSKKRTMPKGKRLIAMLLCMVLLGVGIGATVAYLNDTSNTVTNTFIPAEVRVAVEESFNGTTKTNVVIRNVDSNKAIPAFIRAKIVVTWQNAAGEVHSKTPGSSDYSMELGTGWSEHNGYYYYNSVVNPGEATGALITSATQTGNAPENGYYLCIDILASGIQSTPTSAVQERWGVVPGTSSGT